MSFKETFKSTFLGHLLVSIKHNLINAYYKKNISKEAIKKIKNSKQNKRCFIIGNGPSLTVADLEKLVGEDCFAANRIYKIFSKTHWRPAFYCSQDTRILDEIASDINYIASECKNVFLTTYIYKKIKHIRNNIVYFFLNYFYDYSEYPHFSLDVSKEIWEGFTVTYMAMQIAVYMGYKEIYLLGVDHSYNYTLDEKGNTITFENVQNNYMPEIEGTCYPPQLFKSTLAYKKTREVCEAKGVIIKNATRGGQLEVFDRVDFDDLF